MTDLTKKDREILTLRAARMSTGTIASLVGRSEDKVYNRLAELRITTAAQAVALLASADLPDLSGWSRIGGLEFGALLSFATVSYESATANFHRVNSPPPPAPQATEAERLPEPPAPPRSAPPSPSTCAPGSSGKSSSAAIPTATMAAASQRKGSKPVRRSPSPSSPVRHAAPAAGVIGIKPVCDRIATWAGHFRRARWPLAEVADLFDVAEDDLAQALGEAA